MPSCPLNQSGQAGLTRRDGSDLNRNLPLVEKQGGMFNRGIDKLLGRKAKQKLGIQITAMYILVTPVLDWREETRFRSPRLHSEFEASLK